MRHPAFRLTDEELDRFDLRVSTQCMWVRCPRSADIKVGDLLAFCAAHWMVRDEQQGRQS